MLDNTFLSEGLTDYLVASPGILIVAIGLTALLESLAVVGLVVPGVAILFGLCILAGQIQVSISLLIISGIIGSIIGDFASFWLGKHLQNDLLLWGPIKKRPLLIHRASRMCEQYGIVSLLIARFIGPLRPLVPITAGMLDFPWIKFSLVACVGACLWAPVYLLPGYYSTEAFTWVVDWVKSQF